MNNAAVKKGSRKKIIVNALLVVLVIALMVAPFILKKSAAFEGTDNLANKAITDVKPDYKPWSQPLWTPPGSEVESFLFALQAAIGAGIIGYGFGFLHGRKKSRSEDEKGEH